MVCYVPAAVSHAEKRRVSKSEFPLSRSMCVSAQRAGDTGREQTITKGVNRYHIRKDMRKHNVRL